MTVRPDGSFFFSEQQMNLLEVNEYSACVQIFGDKRRAEGMIKYSDDDILAICGTDIFTLPEYMGLSVELKSGNTALRNKESRDEYLTSVTEIRSFRRDGCDFYFIGVCGSGIQSALRNAALIRCVEQYGTGSGDFRRMLPLMNVAFVRNGRLTVVPFPFKYLREYILGT
jgi:putative ATPase